MPPGSTAFSEMATLREYELRTFSPKRSISLNISLPGGINASPTVTNVRSLMNGRFKHQLAALIFGMGGFFFALDIDRVVGLWYTAENRPLSL